jgi:flagellin-like hook-associated protein FlgL
MGSVGGLTGNDIVTQLNAGLAGTGITISLAPTTGYLTMSSSSSFGAWVDAVSGAGTAIQGSIDPTAAPVINTGRYNFAGGTVSNLGTAGQTLTFTPAGASAINVALLSTDTKEDVFNKLRAGLAGSGIDVVRIGTDEVSFQSASDFAIARNASATSTGGVETITTGYSGSATDKLASSDPTTDAQTALSAVANAIVLLGNVQGKVGSGQNKLYYAIQLAQSQISSFSAADSRIRDADVAAEAANLTKAQVLLQASMAAMAQANTAPQAVLALLRA